MENDYGSLENKSHKTDWITISAILFLALVAGFIFWLVKNNESNIKSFADCAAAGNPIQESYPEACVTKKGKRFVNEDQLNYLEIEKWGIRLNIINKSKGVTHTIKDNKITLSSPELDDFVKKNRLCAAANKQAIIERTKDVSDVPKNRTQVGEYYYFSPKSKVAPCIGTDISRIKQLNDKAYELQWQLPDHKDIEQTPITP